MTDKNGAELNVGDIVRYWRHWRREIVVGSITLTHPADISSNFEMYKHDCLLIGDTTFNKQWTTTIEVEKLSDGEAML
jgi:hypothetical protein